MSTPAITGPSATQNTTTAAPAAAATNPLADQNIFLQLLVTQLKNQDPTSPQDPSAMLTQLATFTEVSNTTTMAADLAAIKIALTTPPPATTTPSTTPTA
jgi:flagellar basal-body rod modification protein FlgD